jgi:hypothetical protein
MKDRKLSNLVLHQETLRHLTREELKTVAGGFAISFPLKTCPSGFTCPECNPPAR